MVLEAPLEIINEIDLPEVNIKLKANGIVYVYLKNNTILDVELQAKLFDNFHQITNGKLAPFLFWSGEEVTVTKEARENAILIEDKAACSETAVIVKTLASKLIANFYLQFNKPKKPYKVFNNEVDAVKWLKSFDH